MDFFIPDIGYSCILSFFFSLISMTTGFTNFSNLLKSLIFLYYYSIFYFIYCCFYLYYFLSLCYFAFFKLCKMKG